MRYQISYREDIANRLIVKVAVAAGLEPATYRLRVNAETVRRLPALPVKSTTYSELSPHGSICKWY